MVVTVADEVEGLEGQPEEVAAEVVSGDSISNCSNHSADISVQVALAIEADEVV